jgi:carbonic anhydrase
VLDDVAHIRNHPLVPKSIPVHGYIYDVTQGTLTELEGVRTGGASA